MGRSSLNNEVPIPKWFAYLIITTYLGLVGILAYFGEKSYYAQKLQERQELLRECFGRMSTDPEIIEAYRTYDKMISDGTKEK